MSNPSVMSHNFSQVPSAEIPRASFDRSHGNKTAFDSGYLIPIFVDEVLPGDTFNLSMTAFGRLATPIFPFMDNVFLDSFFFAVPIRLIWDNWQRFNGEQDNPADSTDFLTPQIVSPASIGYGENSLSDYFGIPTAIPDLTHSAFWHRAYNLIYNEWFRDENLQDSVIINKGDGPDDPADYAVLRRGKRHDYFTSSLPFPQKGPSVELPLGTSAPIAMDVDTGSAVGAFSTVAGAQRNFDPTGPTSLTVGSLSSAAPLYADLSDATAATINQLRQAFQVQKLYERDARGGTRYTEIIRAHFGVTSPDARLQRPEYLGGGSSPLNINPIAQTSPTSPDLFPTPQGNLAAIGTTTLNGHGFTKSFTEHCVIIGIISARADLSYQQGLNRMWSRQTRFDYYWPALSHIGEQAVLNKEIYAEGSLNPTDDNVFGYQERFAEYRYKPSTITSTFRSNSAATLDAWHLAQDFETLPVLNAEFIVEEPPIKRVIATPTEPDFIMDTYFRLKCARPMPMYSVPGLIDHF